MSRRYAVVGTGARAEMFIRALTRDHAGTSELVGLCDRNPLRIAAHDRWLSEAGHPGVPGYPAERLADMLAEQRVDTLVVTSMDREHARHIVTALEAGCDVLTEKPMTTDAAGARAVLDAQRRTGKRVAVTFNYRFNPVHEKVRTLLASGAVGEIGSVHFEWLLDVRHGADYFRRWHRDRANSGGLLVHKSGHHFDLVNWWLGARPESVFASGRLFFYGDEAGARHGYARDYQRAHGSPAAADDPFAIRLDDNDRLRALYLDAEPADGYLRDRNVFSPGVTIQDDMAVLVRYDTGATMTYHLTAYAPWEGYRLMVNGSKGRLELEVVESDHVSPAEASALKGAAVHGEAAAAEQGWVRLTLHPHWSPPQLVPLPGRAPRPGDAHMCSEQSEPERNASGDAHMCSEQSGDEREGHGGADKRMLDVLLGAAVDPLDRSATARDGALALLTGLAANRSMDTGGPVRVSELLDLETE
ncbi:Gfo/Idh/MocA family oxidoreductase [Actinoplanes sp. NBRC 103695]|uniref:Gfo/Idh/MocA family protein n=1 Tax=Actinoplanes sp. NBRC 103695 TaxID=3032202 RepID=UPI00255714B3|nr:Gfo/Idh/MocA family oxidoreductase [Actinoplanes sp. NBRC 103695]